MDFWLGTHRPNWIGQLSIPLFVSRRRLTGRKTFPRATGPIAIDSGGFTELSMYGGWTLDARSYTCEVRRFYSEIGNVDWIAPQDWMCEPAILAQTRLSVGDHQRLTIENFLTLRDIAPDLPIVPVLQGWTRDDYLRCIDAYALAGVTLSKERIVGLGSVCRRQGTDEIAGLIRDLYLHGLNLHGFGVKSGGLEKIAECLISSDSLAWSFAARKEGRPTCGSTTHKNCANCMTYALNWRADLLARLDAPRQLLLV